MRTESGGSPDREKGGEMGKIKRLFYRRIRPGAPFPGFPWALGFFDVMKDETVVAPFPINLGVRLFAWLGWKWFRVAFDPWKAEEKKLEAMNRSYREGRETGREDALAGAVRAIVDAKISEPGLLIALVEACLDRRGPRKDLVVAAYVALGQKLVEDGIRQNLMSLYGLKREKGGNV
jgi:hypothetical protein